MNESESRPQGKFHIIDEIDSSKGWNKMGSSNALRNGRGGAKPTARHAKHAFDEGEDGLFALSLDDVMSDRPWTAEELMGGGARPTSAKPAPSATPAPASVPADDFATRPNMQATRKAAPAPRPASDPSETAAFLAAAAQRPTADNTIRYAAPQQPAFATPEPELEPPVMNLDDLANRQFAFDSWAAADLDETSGGMPALDIPVNPLFAAAETHESTRDNAAAYANRPSEQARADRIETEDYDRASSGYSRDPFAAAPAPEYNDTGVKAASASSYTHDTDDERTADYHTEEESPHFSEFPQAAKVVFIAIVIALLGLIAFEGFQLFRGPTASESATQQQEDDNEYLDINTLKGDPNSGDE